MKCCNIGSHDCNVSIDIPDNMKHHYTKGVCADKCLVPHIKKLWTDGYVPIASCCGHGKIKPMITIKVELCTAKKN